MMISILPRSPKQTSMLLAALYWPPLHAFYLVMVSLVNYIHSNLLLCDLKVLSFSTIASKTLNHPSLIMKNMECVDCGVCVVTMDVVIVIDIGVMTGAAIYIKKDLKVSDVQIEILLGIINLYSLIGSCLAGRTSDWIGRRYTIVFAGTIFFAGAILMGFSPNYAFLMFGRFVAGIGIGYALMIGPVYSAEVSPASYRGFLTSFTDVMIYFFFAKYNSIKL